MVGNFLGSDIHRLAANEEPVLGSKNQQMSRRIDVSQFGKAGLSERSRC
jgi:hypothetical protein